MKIYNKLIRDKIPEIIKNSGRMPEIQSLDKNDTLEHLILKFDEEIEEFKEAYSIEELADILEIIHGLAYHLDYDMNELEEVRRSKYEKRGGFREGIKLMSVSKE